MTTTYNFDAVVFQLNDLAATCSSASGAGYCISSVSQNPDAAMKMLNLMYTDEICDAFYCPGYRGENIILVDENGCSWFPEGEKRHRNRLGYRRSVVFSKSDTDDTLWHVRCGMCIRICWHPMIMRFAPRHLASYLIMPLFYDYLRRSGCGNSAVPSGPFIRAGKCGRVS